MYFYKKIFSNYLIFLLFVSLSANIAFAQQNEHPQAVESIDLPVKLPKINTNTVEEISKQESPHINVATESVVTENVTEKPVEVGKHLNTELDAMSMILSLLLVLVAIVGSAVLLKRFQISQQYTSGLKVVMSLSLGHKERIVVVQAGEKQLVLGVTAQQITLLESLDEPLNVTTEAEKTNNPLLNLLQKRAAKS